MSNHDFPDGIFYQPFTLMTNYYFHFHRWDNGDSVICVSLYPISEELISSNSGGIILGNPGVTHSVPTAFSGYGMGHAWVTEDVVASARLLPHGSVFLQPAKKNGHISLVKITKLGNIGLKCKNNNTKSFICFYSISAEFLKMELSSL